MADVTPKRIIVLIIVFGIGFLIAVMRLFDLQVLHYDFYREKVEGQRQRIVILASPRGDICDRNGELLATTVDSYSFFAIPKEVTSAEAVVRVLQKALNLNAAELSAKLHGRRTFVWLKRKVDKAVAEPILAKGFKGIYALEEKKRIYPRGRLASTVLGFVGVDNQGLAGVELSCDKYLRGQEGKLLTEQDPRGHEIVAASKQVLAQPAEGMNLKLTIDSNIQYFAEKELSATVKQYSAKSGTIIVMDPNTGEILAMATKPDFDPQFYFKSPNYTWKSGAVTTVYEPGSTFKVITVASGLQTGAVNPDTRLKFLSSITVGGKVIKNSHTITKFGSTISISEMLQESINTGAVQIGLKMGPQRFYDQIVKFGFGDFTRIQLPGEECGILRHFTNWYKPDIAMITFGQSIAVTPIQMVAAYSVVANGGKWMRPSIVSEIKSLDGKFLKAYYPEVVSQPISEKVSQQVISMLEDVVLHGSARRARLNNYRVAAKTGTAQKPIPGGLGYLKGSFYASMLGFAPASKPKLLVMVLVDEPKGSIWGESVAGPVVGKVLEKSLRYLNVAPDII
ncbi:MAG: penicillin-binding protein 2 [Candidatus Margulisiibacteriota bacterium]